MSANCCLLLVVVLEEQYVSSSKPSSLPQHPRRTQKFVFYSTVVYEYVPTKRELAPPSSTSDHVARARAPVRAKARCGRERVVQQRGRGRRVRKPGARRHARPATRARLATRPRPRSRARSCRHRHPRRGCRDAERGRLIEPGLRRGRQARKLLRRSRWCSSPPTRSARRSGRRTHR
jgi:hypothetical protein